jgi:hypothetical protein
VARKEVHLAHGIRLRTVDEIESNKECSFCCLIWQIFSSSSKESVLPLKPTLLDFWLDNFAISIEGKITLKNHEQRKGPAAVQLEILIRELKFLNGIIRWSFKTPLGL